MATHIHYRVTPYAYFRFPLFVVLFLWRRNERHTWILIMALNITRTVYSKLYTESVFKPRIKSFCPMDLIKKTSIIAER